jgi:pimeloyl-ACP methyl ester carboxylesterase
VADLADALGLGRIAVLGSSGGAAYALACGVKMPHRVAAIGILGGVAPPSAPDMLRAMSVPLRIVFRLARIAPLMLRGLFRLQLRAIRRGGVRASERMVAWAPEPDRPFLRDSAIRQRFTECFQEACRQGTRGAVLDTALVAAAWGFDLGEVKSRVVLWHGNLDKNVPVASGRYLASALPNCVPTFYADEAHLSLPMNHQQEILGAMASALTTQGN